VAGPGVPPPPPAAGSPPRGSAPPPRAASAATRPAGAAAAPSALPGARGRRGALRAWFTRLTSRRWNEPQSETADWLRDANRALLEQEPLRARGLLYVVAGVASLLLLWSACAELDQVTRGEGKVIPSQQVQIVQSVDGGVVTEILRREGDVVERGELLVRLDATRFASSLRESRAELMALQAKAARLRAIAERRPFEPPADLVQTASELIAAEAELYDSTLAELDAGRQVVLEQLRQREQERVGLLARLEQAQRSLELAARELKVTRPLVVSGAVSGVELLRLEREVARLRGEAQQTAAQIAQTESSITEARRKIDEFELGFINQQRESLSDVAARIASLTEGTLGLSDRVKQTEVRSPVRGTVKRLFQNTIGGVVMPGKEVCEIVPLGDALLLEARIRPKDIGFLRPGQAALVKFTAYDFAVYGGLEAVVDQIGADTVTDEHGNPFYTVRVRTLESSLGEGMPIIPGMVAEVDVLTGKKTVLASLLKPILRAQQYALSER
jgi:adhesin transport system membrane fusion protein